MRFCRLYRVGTLRTRNKGERTHTRGEAGVMIQWSWRVESQRAVRFGSWSGERRMTNGIHSLQGRRVEGIALCGRLPELSVALSGALWLHSFTTVEGQPEWTLFLLDGSWLTVRRGCVVRERAKSPNPAPEPTPAGGEAGCVGDAPLRQ